MRATNRKLTIGAVVMGLVFIGLVGLGAQHSPEWKYLTDGEEQTRKMDEFARYTAERREMHHSLTVDLASRRISLAHAVELLIRVNADWDGYLATIQMYFPGSSREESVALHLLHRVTVLIRETPSIPSDVMNTLEDEFASLFGRRPRVEPDAKPTPDGNLAQAGIAAP